MGPNIVIYWHRYGLKVYQLNPTPVIIKEIGTNDVPELEKQLKTLAGNKVHLLLADSISYLFTKEISPPITVDQSFRIKLQEIIKADIPEDFSTFLWDYKINANANSPQQVTIFAPIKEFQTLINNISQKLLISFVAIEPESISASRDPNPIIGITKKNDIEGKDEEILNISVTPVVKLKKNYLPLFIVIFIVLNLIGAYFYLNKSSPSVVKPLTTAPAPTTATAPTISPTPTIKLLSSLTITVQNGTPKPGYASTMAAALKNDGLVNVEVGNADMDTYPNTLLIFKSNELKDKYLPDLIKIIPVLDSNISVDTNQLNDVKFILGII